MLPIVLLILLILPISILISLKLIAILVSPLNILHILPIFHLLFFFIVLLILFILLLIFLIFLLIILVEPHSLINSGGLMEHFLLFFILIWPLRINKPMVTGSGLVLVKCPFNWGKLKLIVKLYICCWFVKGINILMLLLIFLVDVFIRLIANFGLLFPFGIGIVLIKALFKPGYFTGLMLLGCLLLQEHIRWVLLLFLLLLILDHHGPLLYAAYTFGLHGVDVRKGSIPGYSDILKVFVISMSVVIWDFLLLLFLLLILLILL